MNYLLLENYIKELLKENKELINRINMFDFDMTLFKSTSAPKSWDTRASGFWYNSEASLNQLYYDDKLNTLWIEDIVKEVKKSMNDPTCLTVMCTARSDADEIIYVTNELLRLKGLEFDYNCLFYKPQKFKGSTAQYKANVAKTLLNSYSFCNELHFWEDNLDNLAAVKKLIDNNNMLNPNRQILFFDHVVKV